MALEKRMAIVGCGHSGTFHMSVILQKLGLNIPHERMGTDGIVSWGFTHIIREQFREFGLPTDAIVFQQVRHPLEVISSLYAMDDGGWNTMQRRAKGRGIDWNPLADPHPIRGMKYWLIWNDFAQGIANYRYRIEDIKDALPVILEMIGLPPAPLPVVPVTINKHVYSHIYTWMELCVADSSLYEQVLAMSIKYGY